MRNEINRLSTRYEHLDNDRIAKLLSIGGHKWSETDTTWPEPAMRALKEAAQRMREMMAENERLKAGRFTEDEFQGLCHTLSAADGPQRFCEGCEAYQKQLFGESPITRLREALVPFAALIENASITPEHKDGETFMTASKENLLGVATCYTVLTVGDLRRAKAALTP